MANDILARITVDMRQAMKSGDKDRLGVLRMLIASLKDAQLREEGGELDEGQELAVLRKAVKMRQEAVAQARQGGREDVAVREEAEIRVIEAYLPAAMSPSQLAEKVQALAAEIGYAGPKDRGRFMKEWMARYRGLAEGKDVQEQLQKLS